MKTSGQSARLLLVALALINLVSVSHGVDYTVGGTSQKWAFPPNSSYTYDNEWAKNITFQVGDQLIFIYTTGLHNVRELVSQEDYDMCKLDSLLTKYSSGYDVIELKTSGWHYYVCGALNHCAARNLKVKVFVQPAGGSQAAAGNGGSSKTGPIIGGIVATAIVLILVAVAIWCFRRRRARKALYGQGYDNHHDRQLRSNGSDRKASLRAIPDLGIDGPRVFTHKELAAATKNFSRSELLGRGGFGSVYKGTLRDKSVVAVKAIAEDSRQGESEFLSEVSIIGKIRHRNLVRLRGWCVEKERLMVVYDYMPNGSLDKWIIPSTQEGEGVPPVLLWDARYNILSGISAAMAYLHEEWQQCILHRDVKPSNVLLDDKFNAYLGDFGMARLIDHNKMAYSTVVAGTMGYLAPELPHTRKATPKTDVFSFGVLALEVTCGRRAFDPNLPHAEVYLLDWVWTMHQNGDLKKCVDARLGGDFDMIQSKLTLHLALLACHPDPASRPSMRFIRQVLNGDLSLPTMPPSRPVISYSWSSTMQPTQECISIDVSQHESGNQESVSSDKTPYKSTDKTAAPLRATLEQ